MKKISIIISAWNADKYIKRAIDAIYEQDYKAIQLIIVNDGSTDNTRATVEKCINKFETKKNHELILINQDNQGAAKAYNEALKYCDGDYLYWQDSDDWLEPNVLSKMINILEKNREYQIVRGACNIRNENEIHKILCTKYSQNIENENIFDSYVFEKDSYCFAGIFMTRMDIVKKRVIKKGIYISKAGQNWQLILPISYKTKCKNVRFPIINYLVRPDSHSHQKMSFMKHIKRLNQHKKILMETIERIDEMPRREKVEYFMRIRKKYLIRKTKFILKKLIGKA